MVPNTKYKLVKFEFKTQKNETFGIDDDVRTHLEHVDTKEQITLVYQKDHQLPDLLRHFPLSLPDAQKPKEFAVKKGDQFTSIRSSPIRRKIQAS
jgi:hypothetical protein